jgi:N-methylhydantoinase B/oxoprolinase/acetone carboxylase alpha subunit
MCEIGGVTVADRHLISMLDRYGPKTVYGAVDEILAATEREVRNKIKQIPDGTYYG